MGDFICTQCNQTKPLNNAGGTGYGSDKDGNKFCYSCIGENDRKELSNAKIGDRFTHYMTNSDNEGYRVTNWPGTWKTPILYCRIGRHNIARKRYDVWFKVGKACFHGVTYGDNTQICHIKCIKD